MDLILASQSPRRQQMLSEMGVLFQAKPADIDETVLLDETPGHYVARLAVEKANLIASENQGAWVLGSDTCVVQVCAEDGFRILGKPENEKAAVETLLSLSNQWHQVLTAVALIKVDEHQQVTQHLVSVVTDVKFKPITKEMAHAYWQTGEPADKAGGYGIQGKAAIFIESIKGSYSSVVGLPMAETAQLLMDVGIKGWWHGSST